MSNLFKIVAGIFGLCLMISQVSDAHSVSTDPNKKGPSCEDLLIFELAIKPHLWIATDPEYVKTKEYFEFVLTTRISHLRAYFEYFRNFLRGAWSAQDLDSQMTSVTSQISPFQPILKETVQDAEQLLERVENSLLTGVGLQESKPNSSSSRPSHSKIHPSEAARIYTSIPFEKLREPLALFKTRPEQTTVSEVVTSILIVHSIHGHLVPATEVGRIGRKYFVHSKRSGEESQAFDWVSTTADYLGGDPFRWSREVKTAFANGLWIIPTARPLTPTMDRALQSLGVTLVALTPDLGYVGKTHEAGDAPRSWREIDVMKFGLLPEDPRDGVRKF